MRTMEKKNKSWKTKEGTGILSFNGPVNFSNCFSSFPLSIGKKSNFGNTWSALHKDIYIIEFDGEKIVSYVIMFLVYY